MPPLCGELQGRGVAGAHARGLLSALFQRRTILASAADRHRCESALLAWLNQQDQQTLVFHETIDAAERCHDELVAMGASVAIEHSQRGERETALTSFQERASQFLVTVRSLDEGIDVPEASVALIASGSRSPRQRIQRFGRVLRRQPNKRAVVFSILVRATPEESVVGAGDDELLGRRRLRHHRWPQTPVDLTLTTNSSYVPLGGHATPGELLTELSLEAMEGARVPAPRSSVDRIDMAGFSINVWYYVSDVLARLTIPPDDFRGLARRVRRDFAATLDPAMAERVDVIHGAELEAVLRLWNSRPR